jgi:penicillin-binding protein 2
MSLVPARDRGEMKNVYRFGVFALAVIVGVTTLCARMFFLQVIPSNAAAQGGTTTQATATQSIPASRGLIFAADGTPLVKNVVDLSVTVTPSDLPLDQEPIVAARLASILNLDPDIIQREIDSKTGSQYLPVKIADGVADNVARFIEENADALPGVKVVVASRRQYLSTSQYPTLSREFAELTGYEGQITQKQYDQLVADILGYKGKPTQTQYDQLAALGYANNDLVGQAGLENSYESLLRGTPGVEQVALDAGGKPIPGLVTPVRAAIPGDSLTLNISPKEQAYATLALQTLLTKARLTQGVIIVENPQNGKILAMVSLPSYDNQLFANGISDTDFQALLASPDQPLANKAVGAQYAPGSTFKLVTGTAGLAAGPPVNVCSLLAAGTPVNCEQTDPVPSVLPSIDTSSTFVSQAYIQIGEYKYWEWNKQGWGPLNIYGGVSYSSDTFFYQLAEAVGLTKLTYWADQYGFGKSTGVDLPESATGIVPTDAWKRATQGAPMYEGELMQAGIGQGYDASTPLQLLNAYCALANGGTLYQPQIVKSITDGRTGVTTDVQPVVLNRLHAEDGTAINPAVLATMRVAMRQVVTSRHTGNLVEMQIPVAGKTGTAEFGVPDRNGVLPYHEWFVGYVPGNLDSPDWSKPDSPLAVLAFIYGANTWGNVATEVVKNYLMLHYGVIRREASAFDFRTPGYILPYVTKRTNFYGAPARD